MSNLLGGGGGGGGATFVYKVNLYSQTFLFKVSLQASFHCGHLTMGTERLIRKAKYSIQISFRCDEKVGLIIGTGRH